MDHISLSNYFFSYGTQALVVIAAQLQNLFPEASFEQEIYYPLTWNAFITDFVLPETLLLLIQEDKHIFQGGALNILQETRSMPLKTVCA